MITKNKGELKREVEEQRDLIIGLCNLMTKRFYVKEEVEDIVFKVKARC